MRPQDCSSKRQSEFAGTCLQGFARDKESLLANLRGLHRYINPWMNQ
jgi:hypothetical protein